MHLVTWNVNGLRAALSKEAHLWFQQADIDILCLQETRVRPEQLTTGQRAALEPFHIVWNPAERPGYSGVATLYREPPDRVVLGVGDRRFDGEGRVVQTWWGDLGVFNVYFPNGGRDHARVPDKLEFYAHLLEQLDRLQARGSQIILTGDFNTAHREIDLKNPRQNARTSGFLPEERAWIDTYLAHGFRDAFRELYPGEVQYTWWTYRHRARERNVGWRLDYYLVSAALMPRVREVVVHDQVLGSDHCPVSLFLNT